MDETPARKSKISFPVGILVLVATIILDIISIIPFMGDVEEIPGGVILVLNAAFGLGTPAIVAQGIAMIIKAIPIVQEFPAWTIAWCITWWIEAHPSKASSLIETAAQIAIAEKGGAIFGEDGELLEGEYVGGYLDDGTKVVIYAPNAELEAAEGVGGGAPTEAAGGEVGSSREKTESIQGKRNAQKAKEQGVESKATEEEGDISETEAEEDPEDVTRRKLLEEAPDASGKKEAEDEEDEGDETEKSDSQSNKEKKVKVEEIRSPKAQKVKREQQRLKQPGEITAENDEDTFKKAA